MTGPTRAAEPVLAVQKSTAFAVAAARAGLTVRPGKSAVKNEYRRGVTVRAEHKFVANVDLDADL